MTKLSRDEQQRRWEAFRARPGNSTCAECAASDTTWAVLDYGILICIHCAGAHRALGSHTIKTLMSGATAAVGAQMHYDAMALRSDIGTKGKNERYAESAKFPMLFPISPGAAMLIDQAFVSFNQEAYSNSRDIRDSLEIHSRLTRRCAQAGMDILTAKLAASTGVVPPHIAGRLDPEAERKERVTRKKKPAAAKPSS